MKKGDDQCLLTWNFLFTLSLMPYVSSFVFLYFFLSFIAFLSTLAELSEGNRQSYVRLEGYVRLGMFGFKSLK